MSRSRSHQPMNVFALLSLKFIMCSKNQRRKNIHIHVVKGWFPYDRRRSQTIADRQSQIADDRKESCFHIIADDRKRSQRRLQPYISVSRNVKCTRALCSRQNLFSKQHSGHRGGNFAASKFTSSISPEATASSASKAKETSVLSSKNVHEETKTWGIPHTAERTSCF